MWNDVILSASDYLITFVNCDIRRTNCRAVNNGTVGGCSMVDDDGGSPPWRRMIEKMMWMLHGASCNADDTVCCSVACFDSRWHSPHMSR